MLSIRSNIASFDAQRNMSGTSNALQKSMERLSSGFRINRAGDDAAGLAISEKLKAQVGGLLQAARNAGDGISMIQTAEGGLDEIQTMMQRVRELAVEASNDTLGTTERKDIAKEVSELHKEIENLSKRTTFNGQTLLNGSLVTTQDLTGTAATGTLLSTTGNATVTNVDVSGANAGKTFTFSKSGSDLVLTESGSGATQTIKATDLSAIAANKAETLDFSSLGIKLTLTSDAGGKTVADIITDLGTAGLTIKTGNASASAKMQTGANKGDETTVAFVDTRIDESAATEMAALKAAMVAFEDGTTGGTRDQASDLILKTNDALDFISTQRATLGAGQNRLEHSVSALKTAAENLDASNSRIRDVDVAEESGNMARSQILMQAGVSVLAQANQIPQLALKLLG